MSMYQVPPVQVQQHQPVVIEVQPKQQSMVVELKKEIAQIDRKKNCGLWCKAFSYGCLSFSTGCMCCGCCGHLAAPIVMIDPSVNPPTHSEDIRMLNCIQWCAISTMMCRALQCCGCCCGGCCIMTPYEYNRMCAKK
jgi:hypothetical protein